VSLDLIIEREIKKIIYEKTESIGGPFKTDLENGPKNHGSRPLGNWQSDNAWDLFAPAGSVVNSYTDGKVLKVKNSSKKSGKIYGTQVTVSGSDDYPDIFYTHLKNVKLSKGDIVKVGDKIGEVSEWESSPKSTHVHIGLPRGEHLRDLLKNSSVIFNGKGFSKETDDEIDFDNIDNKKKSEDLKDLSVDKFMNILKGSSSDFFSKINNFFKDII